MKESDRWFHWLIAFTAIVALGCSLEVFESAIEAMQWRWHKTGKPFQEDGARWTIPASVIGVLFVIAGVGGEGYFEARQATAETAIRQHDEAEVARVTQQAGDAKQSATNAACAADRAQNNADAAERKADAVGVVANTARGQADSVAETADGLSTTLSATLDKLNASEAKRFELEKSLAPRTFGVLSKDDLAQLRVFAGTKVILRYLPDAEAERAAADLMGALTDAGWTLEQAIADPSRNTPFFDGIVINPWSIPTKMADAIPSTQPQRMQALAKLNEMRSQSVKTADELVNFLIVHGWTSRDQPTSDEEGPPNPISLVINVGFKPSPYFDPEQVKKSNATFERLRQKKREYMRRHEERMRELEKNSPR